MKVKIICKEENRKLYVCMLEKSGFQIADSANLTFMEDSIKNDYLIGRVNDAKAMVYFKDIIIIESYGRDIVARTIKDTFKINESLEKLEKELKPEGFIRISKSTIIKKSSIIKINPGLCMKFHLQLCGNLKTDVTRSYYYYFKEQIGL